MDINIPYLVMKSDLYEGVKMSSIAIYKPLYY